jgi:hypothetical protein
MDKEITRRYGTTERWLPNDAATLVALHAPPRLNITRSDALFRLREACDQLKIEYHWPRKGHRPSDWLSAADVRRWFREQFGYRLPQPAAKHPGGAPAKGDWVPTIGSRSCLLIEDSDGHTLRTRLVGEQWLTLRVGFNTWSRVTQTPWTGALVQGGPSSF